MLPPSTRYQVEAVLGQGGMAVVYRVLDLESNARVALKRIRASRSDEARESAIALFEREYLTLAQLAHPRVVEAYDYGVDDEGPYYTMELLDGGDLQSRAPVPWKQACIYARDICSVLALLHSRRMVYRDLSPRNVRCTPDDRAKLIDFGAMAPMGVNRELVGTPPFVAPEALNLQPLDGRTDLYSLGATLYFTLVQRHAYPARDLTQLPDLWRSRPRRPSEIVADIPEALDHLVLDLINLDPAVRPSNAAEVMARLSAIAGLRQSEQIHIGNAYLSNPTLVGRSSELSRVRKLTWNALRRRGSNLMVRGPSGVGRSRFLDACVLEAKLAGLVVVRVDAGDRQSDEFGIVRALGQQLLKGTRNIAIESAEAHLPVLGRIIPELLHGRSKKVELESNADASAFQRKANEALQHWILQIARRRSLLIAADDFTSFDEPSAALLALLAQATSDQGIILTATAPTGASESAGIRGARELFESSGERIDLSVLTLEQTEQLLDSVFGEVPNVGVAAAYMHGVSAGNPRDIMQLAQHLVNEGVVKYFAGAWSLPARLSVAALPSSMDEALRGRIARLSREARQLALCIAGDSGLSCTFEECAALAPELTLRQLAQALDDLAAAEIVVPLGGRYTLRQQSWSAPLRDTASQAEREHAHRLLAALFEQRGDGFRHAQHLLHSGQHEHGLDTLVRYAHESVLKSNRDARAYFELLVSLPRSWLETYDLALRLCAERNRPAKDRATLHRRIEGIASALLGDGDGYAFVQQRLDELKQQSGLDLYEQLPASLGPGERLKQALGTAIARYNQLPERERAFAPGEALKELTASVISAVGCLSYTQDYDQWLRLPSVAPLAPLSPMFAVTDQLVVGVGARLAGRTEESIETYEKLLRQLEAPDRAGLEVAHHRTLNLRVNLSIAAMEAALGRESCLVRMALVEQEPSYALQSMMVRHLFNVWRGDAREAARCKHELDVMLMANNVHNAFEGQYLFAQLCAYALSDDLTLVKSVTEAIETRAGSQRAWLPVIAFGQAEYQRIRGDHASALQLIEKTVEQIEPGRHPLWPHIAGAHLRALNELGKHEEAIAISGDYLRSVELHRLGYAANYLRMQLATALAASGKHVEAAELADLVIREFQALGVAGINLAVAYVTRARASLAAGDQAGFESFAKLSAEQWPSGSKHTRGAKYQRANDGPDASGELLEELSVMSQFTSMLEVCPDGERRARCGLDFLVRQSGATGGILYMLTDRGLKPRATHGDAEPDPQIHVWADTYFVREIDREESTEVHSDAVLSPPSRAEEFAKIGFIPVLLTHQTDRGYALTGLALLAPNAEKPFTYPSRLAVELSRWLASAGDAVSVYG